MKKLICLLLAAAFCLCLLPACQSAPSEQAPAPTDEAAAEPSAQASQEPSAETAAPADEEGMETSEEAPAEEEAASNENGDAAPISLPIYEEPVSFTWLDIRNSDYEQGVVTEGLAENEIYKHVSQLTGINVEWDLRMDATTTYSLIIAGGDYPDCWGSKFSDVYPNYETALEDEVIIDLTDLIEEHMPNYSAALSSSKSLYDKSFSENGHRLGVCGIQTGYTQFGGQIRGDILDKLGLEAPSTYDDMYQLLLSMKDAYPDSQPMILSKDGSMNCSWLGGGLGVSTTVGWRPFISLNFYQVDGEVMLGLLQPEYREYVELIAKWYSEGLIYQDFYTSNGMGPPQDPIAANKSFVWYGSVNEIPTLTKILTDPDGYIVGMTDVTRNEGDIIHTGDSTERSLVGYGMPISTDCENPSIPLQYFDYFWTHDGYMLANYGFEGETYEYNEAGDPKFTDMILQNSSYTYVSALFKYCIYEGPFELDVGRYFVSFNDAQIDAVKKWEANRDEAWNIPNGVTLTVEEQETAGNLTSDIGTYCSEMILKFMVGDLDIDSNWDEFISTLESLGTQELTEIRQAALDRYNG